MYGCIFRLRGQTMKAKPRWDIYSQQPIMLYHPAFAKSNGTVMVAGVTKANKKGIIWWDAGYIIGEATSGQLGSENAGDARSGFNPPAWRSHRGIFMPRAEK